MKKGIFSFIAGMLVMLALSFTFVPALAEEFNVRFNSIAINLNGKVITNIGETYTLPNGESCAASIIYNNTTFLPIRRISEIVGLQVDWDNESRTVYLASDGYTIDKDTSIYKYNNSTQEESNNNIDKSKIPVYERVVPSTINDYEDFKSMWTIEYNIYIPNKGFVNHAIYRSNSELLKSTWNKTSLEDKTLYAEQLVKEKWDYNYTGKELILTFTWEKGELGYAKCDKDGNTSSEFLENPFA
jgi:hypothetical protein